MRAPGRTHAVQFSTPNNPAKWLRHALLAACAVACAGWIHGQSSQPAQSSGNSQQSGSAQPAPSSQQPMVIGESPDSQDDSGTPPTAPSSTPVPQQPAAAQPAPWNPATQMPEDAGKRSQPSAASEPAPPPTSAAPAPAPIVHVADAGGDQARQQINNECADLMMMANDLKTQVDKTTKDMLSISVIRKANEIEQLAHRVRDEMRPELGKN